jgi:parallel beta-helix repeat protein
MSLSTRSRMFALLIAMTAACMLFAVVLSGQAKAQEASGTVVVNDDNADGAAADGCNDPDANTIQDGVNAASTGDTVLVCPGTYAENVNVDESVSVESTDGADATTVQSANSNNNVFNIAANDVTINGFTVQGTGSATDVVGIGAAGSISGYEILNNTIQDNTFGIYANGSDALIENNLIRNNNRTGAASGNGIYADQGSTNITVNENEFADHANTSILFTGANTGLNITNNDITGNRILLITTTESTVSGNTITDSLFSGVQLGGGNNAITIEDNTITGSGATTEDEFPFPAVRITDNVGDSPNTGIEIIGNNLLDNDAGVSVRDSDVLTDALEVHQNRIFGNDVGIDNGDGDDDGATVNAENNWWGCNEGPNNDGCDGTEGDNIDSAPWIVMDIRANPARVASGGESQIVVRFLLDRGRSGVARQFPDGGTVEFSAIRGRVNPSQQEVTNGSATTTLTTNSKRKAAVVRADFDAESVRERVSIRR